MLLKNQNRKDAVNKIETRFLNVEAFRRIRIEALKQTNNAEIARELNNNAQAFV
ncbi:MAG: hypothetical protein KAS13_07170 [Candidatus Omnitrophica bacterium]|nr:hypothetical protein [Candidatus Omnitrophota bacterium]